MTSIWPRRPGGSLTLSDGRVVRDSAQDTQRG